VPRIQCSVQSSKASRLKPDVNKHVQLLTRPKPVRKLTTEIAMGFETCLGLRFWRNCLGRLWFRFELSRTGEPILLVALGCCAAKRRRSRFAACLVIIQHTDRLSYLLHGDNLDVPPPLPLVPLLLFCLTERPSLVVALFCLAIRFFVCLFFFCLVSAFFQFLFVMILSGEHRRSCATKFFDVVRTLQCLVVARFCREPWLGRRDRLSCLHCAVRDYDVRFSPAAAEMLLWEQQNLLFKAS